jgi:hypothetical protein
LIAFCGKEEGAFANAGAGGGGVGVQKCQAAGLGGLGWLDHRGRPVLGWAWSRRVVGWLAAGPLARQAGCGLERMGVVGGWLGRLAWPAASPYFFIKTFFLFVLLFCFKTFLEIVLAN